MARLRVGAPKLKPAAFKMLRLSIPIEVGEILILDIRVVQLFGARSNSVAKEMLCYNISAKLASNTRTANSPVSPLIARRTYIMARQNPRGTWEDY